MKAEITISVGDIIYYKLRLSDLPINQERVWKGLVEGVYTDFVRISSLDEGYEGMCEPVWFSQVIKVERRIDMETGEPYRTRLEPPPADPVVAHEPKIREKV